MRPGPRNPKDGQQVIVASEVARLIRQHARSHMKTEVCGVLIGSAQNGTLHVEACIAGKNAAQAGTHVTFTQDTWEHIYKIKDEEYPEARIVGWYHSHPGFGIFLSDHDTFIHRNFFSAPEQIAWVYDPHSDEEGFFGWSGDRITRMGEFTFSDGRGGEDSSKDHGPKASMLEDTDEEVVEEQPAEMRVTSGPPHWLRWAVTALSYTLVLMVGLLIAWFVFPRVIAVGVPVDPMTGRPLVTIPDGVLWHNPEPATPPPLVKTTPGEKNATPEASKKPGGASEAKSAQ